MRGFAAYTPIADADARGHGSIVRRADTWYKVSQYNHPVCLSIRVVD